MPHNFFAAAFLLLVAAAPFAWAVVEVLRSPYTPAQSVLFFLNVLCCKFLWRVNAPPRLPLEAKQGAVLVCNHRSSVDPFYVQLVAHRPVHWMVAREWVERGVFGWFLKTCEVIPVSRGGVDTAATKAAIRHCEQGGLVGMFPEGRINMSDDLMLPVRPGAVTIALKARVPILPVYIEGSPFDRRAWSPFFMPAKVRVRFGRLLDISEYYGHEREEELVRHLLRCALFEIARLAGHADFEPRFAGREWKPTEEEVEADRLAGIEQRKRKSRGTA